MEARSLAITVDYEIFGNGTGDVRRHVTEPTERMAAICHQHGVPLTIFVEVEEYLAFLRFADVLRKDLSYDPAALIRQQLIRLAAQGHDLQLHLHPQWHGARYVDGEWILRPDTQTVDDLFETQEEVTEYIRDRKAVLDDLLTTAGAAQRVCAYRAGAFSAQPGVKLIQALAGNGISVDSSVVHGLHRTNQTLHLDYRSSPQHRRHWRVTENVAHENTDGSVTEVPIYSVMGRRLFQATFRRLRAKFSSNVPKERQKEMLGQLGLRKSPLHVLRFLWQPTPIKLDFHNLSVRSLRKMIRAAKLPAGDLDILVLIGHTKEHVDDLHFNTFVQEAATDPRLQIVSLSTIVQRLREAKESGAPVPKRASAGAHA